MAFPTLLHELCSRLVADVFMDLLVEQECALFRPSISVSVLLLTCFSVYS